MIYLLPISVSWSLAMIMLLWRGDPKRRRIAGLSNRSGDRISRRLIVAAVLLPGIVLAASGDAAAFLIWFGSCAIGGWLVAHLRPSKPSEQSDQKGA